jgi:hypothetical protein
LSAQFFRKSAYLGMGEFPVKNPAEIKTVNGISRDQEMGRVAVKQAFQEFFCQLIIVDSGPPMEMAETGMDEQGSAARDIHMFEKFLKHHKPVLIPDHSGEVTAILVNISSGLRQCPRKDRSQSTGLFSG